MDEKCLVVEKRKRMEPSSKVRLLKVYRADPAGSAL